MALDLPDLEHSVEQHAADAAADHADSPALEREIFPELHHFGVQFDLIDSRLGQFLVLIGHALPKLIIDAPSPQEVVEARKVNRQDKQRNHRNQ